MANRIESKLTPSQLPHEAKLGSSQSSVDDHPMHFIESIAKIIG